MRRILQVYSGPGPAHLFDSIMSAINETWSPGRRMRKAAEMRRTASTRWREQKADPETHSAFMRSKLSAASSKHPLAIWRTDPRVNLSARDLAVKLNMTEDAIENWQSGRRRPRRAAKAALLKLSKQIGVPLDLSWC